MIMLIMVLILTPTMHAEAATKVKMNKTKVIVYVGTTEKLKITGTSKKVTWKSNNNRVAKVDKKRKVTARVKLTHYVGQMDSYLVVGKESTCAEEGYYNRICKRCNQIMWTEVMPKKDGHYPSDWIIDEAYCTREGKKHIECTVCKEILE